MNLTQSLEATLDAGGGLEQALALILDHFGAEAGTIHRLGGEGVLQLEAASRNIPPAVLAQVQRVPVGKGMAGLAVLRKEPVSACNLQTDSSGDVRPGARATGMQGAIVVPILDGEKAVGALGIANQRERVFTAAETGLLIEAGRRLARHWLSGIDTDSQF